MGAGRRQKRRAAAQTDSGSRAVRPDPKQCRPDPQLTAGGTEPHMSTFRKLTGMAFFAACGATLGALLGELLFVQPKSAPPPRSICLLFDVSGSMNKRVFAADPEMGRTQVQALQRAAETFVRRQDLHTDALGLVSFASSTRVLSRLGHDGQDLIGWIGRLEARGETDLARGIDAAREVLASAGGARWVPLVTRGPPRGGRRPPRPRPE